MLLKETGTLQDTEAEFVICYFKEILRYLHQLFFIILFKTFTFMYFFSCTILYARNHHANDEIAIEIINISSSFGFFSTSL